MLNRTKFSKLAKRRQNHGSWQKEKGMKKKKMMMKKKPMKKGMKKEDMENKKDVTINVTGVSMSGEADINEHNRTSSDNKKESEDEKICDSREDD